MSVKTAIFSTTALVFLSTAASAELTAQQVWTDWKEYVSGFGYTVEAQENMAGNRLEITELQMDMSLPDVEGSASLTLGSMAFVENGDGTVTIAMPDTMPMTFTFADPDGETVKAAIDYTMQDMNMVASGDPSSFTYDYTAASIDLALKEITIDGETLSPDVIKVAFTLTDLSGKSVMQPGALRQIAQTMTTGPAQYEINFQDPDSSDSMVVNGKLDTLNFAGTTIMPAAMDPEQMAAALADGFALDGTFGYTGSSAEFALTDGGDAMGGSSGAASAEIAVRMNKDMLQYKGSSQSARFNVMGGDIPLPIILEMGEVAFNLMMPVSKSDAPSDFALALKLGDFVTSEDLWSIVDPGQLLPRDPATVAFNLTGKAKMLFDLFDPEQMEAVEDGESMPAELEALKLEGLEISIAGAELTGSGDVTFDNTDLESFGGFPKPTGFVDLALVGGNGLMDKLVELGLLPEQQAMGARMMMGLFARPGEGEDSLTSKLEINEEGHILANGQRIQ